MSFLIGNIKIEEPVFLAPMKGVTDLPFRRLVKSYGAGLVFSEMIASRMMIAQFRLSTKTPHSYKEEFPIAAQIAGRDPDIIAEAARINVELGADIIDLNFGCPIKKIVKHMGGSALMKNEKLAEEIMQETVKAVDVPVTVKMRLGWNEENINVVTLAKKAEDAGVKMITVHGRTRSQLFNGTADWEAVRAVKESVKIPVTVNGDILTPEDAKKPLELSGADAVMIGRGAYGRPWILNQTINYLHDGILTAPPKTDEMAEVILKHYDAILEYHGEFQGGLIARKHFSWYLSQFPNSDDIYREIKTMQDHEAVKDKLRDYFSKIKNTELSL